MSHHHISPVVIKKQVMYADSPNAFETAKEIVRCKLRNCRLLLSGFRQSRQRAGYSNAELLQSWQREIQKIERVTQQAKNRAMLFRMEAHAARTYWKALALLCHQSSSWRREYPHAADSLNILLNTGYTGLARKVLESIEAAGFLPELGVLHGANSEDALAYDAMECFRQSAVDAAIIPFFSRQRSVSPRFEEKKMKRGFWLLSVQFQKRYWYGGNCERLERIMLLEIFRLKSCIIEGMIWKPYIHRWGHNSKCPLKKRAG